jgi:2,4-dienoyl-CoA reductase-like NADH-dependent reductase (Old Yellow Enzyme family)
VSLVTWVQPGRIKTLEEFRAAWQGIDPALDLRAPGGADSPLAQTLDYEIRGKRPGNRFCVHPMEGWDGTDGGEASPETLRRWRRFGESGAKMVWGGEAFAVRADGRANARQLCYGDDEATRRTLDGLLAALREGHRDCGDDIDDLAVGLQLTHSGRFSRPDGSPHPLRAVARPDLERRSGEGADAPILSDEELIAIADRFVGLAVLARDAGFDFVDVKCCHGYLLHELLGARERAGAFGGDFENRAGFVYTLIDRIREAAPELGIGVRLSVADAAPFVPDGESGVGLPFVEEAGAQGFGRHPEDPLAFDLGEPLRFLRGLLERGVRLVNLTLGSPYYNPHLQRPASQPPSDGYLPPRDPLAEVARHLRTAAAVKAALPDLITVGTGYSYLQEWAGAVAAHEVGAGHVDLVGFGRMMLIYPDIVRDLLADRPLARRRICRTFSDCTTAPRHGLVSGCYPLDPFYRERDEAAEVRRIKRAQREDPQ